MAVLWVRQQRRSAVNVSNLGILVGVVGLALTAPVITVAPEVSVLTCIFLAWPVLGWRHIARTGTTITVRRAFGRRQLAADSSMIGYRFEGGYHWAEFKVYVTDGVNTVNLAEHFSSHAGGTGGAQRDVIRLTAMLIDPGIGSSDTAGTALSHGRARSSEARHSQPVARADSSDDNVRRNAARAKVEADRDQIEAAGEAVRTYARSYYDGRGWWVSRKFWLQFLLLAAVVLLYSTVMLVLFEVPHR